MNEDICNVSTINTTMIRGNILMIDSGGIICSDQQKVLNGQLLGAVGVLLIDSNSQPIPILIDTNITLFPNIPSRMVCLFLTFTYNSTLFSFHPNVCCMCNLCIY